MREIRNIGIIGEGKMGTNLFYYLLDFDLRLTWICSRDADQDKLKKTFSRKLNRSLEAGILDEGSFFVKQRDTVITNDLHQIRQCELIIEAVSENLDLKKDLFAELVKIANDDCIFSSNSSSFKPSEWMIQGPGRDKMAGLHFFYPVALKNIAELIISDSISPDKTRKIISFLEFIHRNYLILKEDHGFILNRIFLDFQNEAFLIVNQGAVTIPQMDAIIKKHLFPLGAFDFCDNVGIDIMLTSVRNYTVDYPDRHHYTLFTDELGRLVRTSGSGIKSDARFYNYLVEPVPEVILLKDLKQDVIENAVMRLRKTMAGSIRKFSGISGIEIKILNDAMKEYLGCETDFETW